MKKKRIGDVLRERGALAQADLDRALIIQQEKNVRLGEVLLQNFHLDKGELARAIEQVQGVDYVECPPAMISPATLNLIPRSLAIRTCALPLQIKGNQLVVAMAEPQDLRLVDELRFSAGMPIAARFSFKEDIIEGIKRFYEGGDIELIAEKEIDRGVEERLGEAFGGDEGMTDLEFITASTREENREALKELQAGMRRTTLAVRFVSAILARAAQREASDVHLEPGVGDAMVRLRIDGILREMLRIPTAHQAAVLSRIKILADMDITERRLPQDGRFLMVYRGRKLDVRVSTMPTYFGEKIVMRLLDPRSTMITFGRLGFNQSQATAFNKLIGMPQGMLIVTGPTGSGKSTTLYAALNLVSTPGRNVITIEDPVEYLLDGVNQVQINPRIGLTFASALPTILRQDPDVIMVGEIRDGETAEIALRASQTGHLVFSTLHTNDSLGAITRLHDLGIPPYLISSVSGIMGQRLLRTLCGCRKELPATQSYADGLAALGLKKPVEMMYQPVGCAVCENTGYKGRVGIHELLVMDGAVRDAILAQAPPEEIRGLLKSIGFRTMQEDALEKVREGKTTVEEMMRVVPFDSVPDVIHCRDCGREALPGFRFCPACGAPISEHPTDSHSRSRSYREPNVR